MKKLFVLLTLLAFTVPLFAQQRVITKPDDKEYWIFGGSSDFAILGNHADGADTSAAFPIYGLEGAINLYMVGDTTDADSAVASANNSDSCLVVLLQLKESGFGWSGLYSETTSNYTKLDTVLRTKVNSAGDIYFYLPLAEETAWARGDSARFIFQIAPGDTLPFKAKVSGF